MDKYVKFVIKKKEKISLLFVNILEEKIDFDYSLGLELLKEYENKLTENESIILVVDTRKISYINPKLLWEIIYDILKLNDLGREKIKHQYILTTGGCVSYLLSLITKVHPFIVPTTYCKTNEEVKNFISQY